MNDSKATNVASTLVALEAFPRGTVHLILGGQAKAQDFTALRRPVLHCCEGVYLIGEDAPILARRSKGWTSLCTNAATCEQAVLRARAAAEAGDVVLLSPACASFDQFSDFEARGERFRELVVGIEGFDRPDTKARWSWIEGFDVTTSK